MSKTTFRQLRFVESYCNVGTGTEAARLAGYSSNKGNLQTRASKLLAQDHIQQLIADELAKKASQIEVKATDHAQEVQKIKSRIEFLAEQADSQAVQLKANETLAKIAGMLEDRMVIRKEGEQAYQRLILEKFDESGEERLTLEKPMRIEDQK